MILISKHRGRDEKETETIERVAREPSAFVFVYSFLHLC